MPSSPTSINDFSVQYGISEHPMNDLWGKAIGNLKPADQIAIRQTSTSTDRLQVLQDVLVLARTSEQTSLQKRWMWKNRKGEVIVVRDLFAKMTTWMEKVKSIGDTIVQYDPGHAALPWAAARLILQASINDIQTNGAMLEGMELTFNLIAKSEVIERLYLRRVSTLQAPLDKSLVALYTSILEFLLGSYRYFDQKTIKRIAKSVFRVEEFTASFISKIESNMNEVESYVRLLTGEIATQTETSLTDVSMRMTKLDLQSRKLDNVDAQFASVQDSMEMNMRLLKETLEELNQPINRLATHIRALDDNLKEDERLKIFNWLSTVEYRSHHRSKVKTLLPGSGKSMLVAHVIEYLQARAQGDGGVAYFYCARTANEPERADPTELLRCLLEQMACLDESEPIQLPVVTAYNSRKKEARGRKPEKLGMGECAEVVIELLRLNAVTIIVDGLDECDPTRRQDLLDMFQKIINDANNIVKIFVSSRDDHDIVHRLSQVPNLYIGAVNNKEDIENFVTSRVSEAILKERILCGRVPQQLRNVIVETLIQKSEGMFRLASLHIDRLCDPSQVKTQANVLDTLDHLPLDLKRSYDTILAQIAGSQHPNPRIADRVIKWLICAREPLQGNVFMVAMNSDSAISDSFQLSDILGICCNLVIYDTETNQFRFAHLSVQEYLEQLGSYSLEASNALAAEQCLHWIIAHSTSASKVDSPMIEYVGASLNLNIVYQRAKNSTARWFTRHVDIFWPDYARSAGEWRNTGRLRFLLESFLLFDHITPRGDGRAFRQWLDRVRIPANLAYFYQALVHSWPPNPLFVATAFDITEIVATLIQDSPAALTATTQKGLNCAQIAARCDLPAVTTIIFTEYMKFPHYQYIIRLAFMEAATMGSLKALKVILSLVGDGFLSREDLEQYVATITGSSKRTITDVMAHFFENNKSIEIDERILAASFRSHYGPSIIQSLLKFKETIDLTATLVETAMEYVLSGPQALMILLQSKNTVNLKLDVVATIRQYRDEQWIYALWKRWDKPGKGPCAVYKSPNIIHDFDSSTFRLSWEQLLILREWKDGPQLLLSILEKTPEMDAAAVNMLLSQWDEKAVEALLAFRGVEITDEVIKIVAGNLKYGTKVVELLLEKEAKMLDLMD
ncbi:hypothetical protein BKA61DRAFT_578491 [Leptodontidium sp. MPI-SDFR-AT-0119]|nr:hypothetical protein BKA61DRAFT_578491 [Leptodontidium sp. MPI-SDFR-AT-0119]